MHSSAILYKTYCVVLHFPNKLSQKIMATRKCSPSGYTSESTDSDSEYAPYRGGKGAPINFENEGGIQRRARQPKSFSRNAQMARQNRLRKKMYVENLERELAKERTSNKRMAAVLERQAKIIKKQETDVKYMRSVLANSTDISRLLRSIHTNTGMCVGTSLDKNLTIQNEQHPWFDDTLTNDLLLPGDNFDMSFLDAPLSEPQLSPSSILEDHSYTLNSPAQEEDSNIGVCLHISKHKLALEFCASCSENAGKSWGGEEQEV